MLHQTNLQGMTTAHLEQLRRQITLDFFAPESTDSDRDELCKFDDVVMNCIPHSFVLASLFDVEVMSNDIPEHIYESDPSLEWVTCPCCDGEKWLEVEGNVWTKALFSDPRRAYAHRHLNHSYKVCGRCSGVGEVLDDLTVPDGLSPVSNQHQVGRVKPNVMNTVITPKETPVVWQLAA